MRWSCVLAMCCACGAGEPTIAGEVALVLDLPDGMLEPKGYSSVELVLHAPGGDVVKSASLDAGGFDLGRVDPSAGVSIEATLRSDSGAAVGYGRTAVEATLARDAEIVVPMRRPIAYIAGTVSRDVGPTTSTVLRWSQAPATFSDLSIGSSLDGSSRLPGQAVLMVAAGGSLYLVSQVVRETDGTLVGPATITPVSTADHALGTALTGTMSGGALDGAGTDDGAALAIGTTTQLYAIDTVGGTARTLAVGRFTHVAIVGAATGAPVAIAIRDRGSVAGACALSTELWWAPLTADGGPARMVAAGSFSDVAADRGRAYYVDACSGMLGELTESALTPLRMIPGKPTALAVSNGQAYVGLEAAPATTSLVVASLSAPSDPPRQLWSETAQQVLNVVSLPEVRRQLTATAVTVAHLEIGAGGDYVALTTRAHFFGEELAQVRFPETTIDSEELRVFDAATGGIVQRYRSWCDGTVLLGPGDISGWSCATTSGQTEAFAANDEHHIQSMTFQFGKK